MYYLFANTNTHVLVGILFKKKQSSQLPGSKYMAVSVNHNFSMFLFLYCCCFRIFRDL